MSDYYQKNKDRIKEQKRNYYLKNKAKHSEWNKKWKKNNLERLKETEFYGHIKRSYGLDRGEYDQLASLQNGKCYICNTETKLYVDHCHTTLKVGKLLCHHCNSGLGYFKDDLTIMEKAIQYVKDYR